MPLRKHWKIAAVALLIVLSFVFSEGFRQTLVRRHAISNASAELEAISSEVTDLKKQITRLESEPDAVEEYVRKDLGYLRPGEKEVRFLGR